MHFWRYRCREPRCSLQLSFLLQALSLNGGGRAVHPISWRTAYRQHGLAGLENRKTAPKNPANRTAPEIVEKVLYLRKTYRLGPIRIVWYLARYHAITISD